MVSVDYNEDAVVAREVPLGSVAGNLCGLGVWMEAKFQNCSEIVGIIDLGLRSAIH